MEMLLSQLKIPSPIEEVFPSWIVNTDYRLFIKRDELIHLHICGNKWRKLKYNLLEAQTRGVRTIISFGGAFSNHLVALAAACHYLDLESVGIIGTHSSDIHNTTISILKSYGMELHMVQRQDYRLKESAVAIQEILANYSGYFLIPEGGSNEFAIQGVVELVSEIKEDAQSFNSIFCGIGTGGTIAGLVEGLYETPLKIFAVSPFKYDEMKFSGLDLVDPLKLEKIEIVPSHLSSKFAGFNYKLVSFMDSFFEETGILLDPVYTAKAMSTLKSYVNKKKLDPGSNILFLHTGGLQGIEGFNDRHKCKLLTH